MEEERDILLHRLGEGPGESMFKQVDHAGTAFPNTQPLGSPDKKENPAELDIRVAALESANRSLQDELRGLYEENERLREEVDSWRRWDQEMQNAVLPQVSDLVKDEYDSWLTKQQRALSLDRHHFLPQRAFDRTHPAENNSAAADFRLPPLRMQGLPYQASGPLPSPSSLNFRRAAGDTAFHSHTNT